MNVPSEIKELFKNLATAHPDILHEDVEGKIAFYVDQLSDILEGVFKSGLKPDGISFRFVSPMFQPISDETHNVNLSSEGMTTASIELPSRTSKRNF